ncbi:hypothetical protein INT45_003719 [Circinella minor]|uniref:Uncharacterized protein n=1 Tax=Circinella minor TaxID=1195481 RepID=A0A8H7S6N0_9FUNG|nr:hypothetical protein INT45_003719 [Circinella minor]
MAGESSIKSIRATTPKLVEYRWLRLVNKTRPVNKLDRCSAKSWTAPTELVDSINDKNLLKYDTEDLYNKVLNSFYQLSHAVNIPTDVKTYAKKCYAYAANESFKSEFIKAASTKKHTAEEGEVNRGVSRLAKKGKMKAINIIDTSLDVVGDQVQDVLEGDYSSDENHHPLRTNEYILSYNNEEAGEEEEEDNEEQENSDWIVDDIYNISQECYAFKNNILRSQGNPSTLSDIKILYS